MLINVKDSLKDVFQAGGKRNFNKFYHHFSAIGSLKFYAWVTNEFKIP